MARAGSFLAIAFAVLAGACQSTTQAKETSSGGASAAQTTGVAPGATTTGTAGAGTGTASSTSTGGGISTSGGTLIGSVTTIVKGMGGGCALGDGGQSIENVSGLAWASEGLYVNADQGVDLFATDTGAFTLILPDSVLASNGLALGRADELFVFGGGFQEAVEIFKVIGSGAVLFAGNSAATCLDSDESDGGASFLGATALAGDDAGNVYVSDDSTFTTPCSRIRKIDPSGRTTTLAGNTNSASQNGPGPDAEFSGPVGLAVDAEGNVYVADFGNNQIRKVTSDGTTTTLAGSEFPAFDDGTGGPGGTATFNMPYAVAVDAAGIVYVADQGNNAVRMVAANGTTTTLGGDGNPGFMDGTLGLDGGSEFSRPDWIAVDPPGRNVYVSDNGNCAIRVIHIDR